MAQKGCIRRKMKAIVSFMSRQNYIRRACELFLQTSQKKPSNKKEQHTALSVGMCRNCVVFVVVLSDVGMHVCDNIHATYLFSVSIFRIKNSEQSNDNVGCLLVNLGKGTDFSCKFLFAAVFFVPIG